MNFEGLISNRLEVDGNIYRSQNKMHAINTFTPHSGRASGQIKKTAAAV